MYFTGSVTSNRNPYKQQRDGWKLLTLTIILIRMVLRITVSTHSFGVEGTYRHLKSEKEDNNEGSLRVLNGRTSIWTECVFYWVFTKINPFRSLLNKIFFKLFDKWSLYTSKFRLNYPKQVSSPIVTVENVLTNSKGRYSKSWDRRILPRIPFFLSQQGWK